jgi:4-carboxymuconolactone decarboxylase
LLSAHTIERAGGPVDELPLAEEINDLAAEFAFGEIWSRPGLDLRMRSAVTIAVLVSDGRTEQVRTHINGGLNTGLTPEEILEILLHVGGYAGFAASAAGRTVALEVFKERGIVKP